MYCENSQIFIEDDDQCISCDNYAHGVACPLLTALGEGAVFMEGCLIVRDCGFYKKFKRTLRLVKDDE